MPTLALNGRLEPTEFGGLGESVKQDFPRTGEAKTTWSRANYRNVQPKRWSR